MGCGSIQLFWSRLNESTCSGMGGARLAGQYCPKRYSFGGGSLSVHYGCRSVPAVLFLSSAFAVFGQAPSQANPGPGPGSFVPPPLHVNAPLGEIRRMPGDGTGAYKTGVYRDLFAEAGHPPMETKAKIEKAFQQLFHGDSLAERVYFEAGS